MEVPKFIGARVKRREDPRLIQGLARYVDDIAPPGTLHVAIVRSIYAHAALREVDTSAAREAPGVVAVFTAEDLSGVGPVPVASSLPGLRVPHHPVLARGVVRYVGEPIAAVVAESRYSARDAADLVRVECEPREAAVDPEEALKPGSVRVHEEFPDNVAFTWEVKGGDVEAGFREADKIIRQKMVNQRVAPLALEPRGVVAHYLPGEDRLTLWSSTQIPHLLRSFLAAQLGLAENRIRVVAPEVGGGFGSKLNVYREEALLAFISRKLGRPAKWTESRSENFLATIHGRGQAGELELGVKRDGTLTALRYNVVADVGAYLQLLTPAIFTLTGLMLPGPYRLRNIHMHVRGVFTHKMATDAYRGAGRPEATYVLERMMDLAAAELGMDPAEVRKRNFPAPHEFPYPTAAGLTYDSGNYPAALERALQLADYRGMRAEQARARREGRYLGIGLSSYVEICGVGPSPAMFAGGWESATVRVEPSGKVTVLTGASPHGQGQETTFAQIVADGLGVALEDVLVLHGDTDVVQYGIGTFGSRGTAVGGTAVHEAQLLVREKMARFAALALEADPKDIAFAGGRAFVQGSPEKSLPFARVARMAYDAKKLPSDTTPGLEATYFFEPKNFTFPFGTHLALVEVDPETGAVELKRYVAVDDCGVALNPLLVDGQVHGGIAQGVGQALEEELVYDPSGQPLNASLMHYSLPRANRLPSFETARTVTPTPVNPLGAKGVGEAGTIGSTPAVVNAVLDALKPFGVRHIDMPLRAEKVWRAVREKKGGAR